MRIPVLNLGNKGQSSLQLFKLKPEKQILLHSRHFKKMRSNSQIDRGTYLKLLENISVLLENVDKKLLSLREAIDFSATSKPQCLPQTS